MMDDYELSNILFLKGVLIRDCDNIEDEFEKRLLHKTEEVEPVYRRYDKIPSKFTTLATWIKHTNLKCWWCSRHFHSVPLFMPISVSRYEQTEFAIKGNFDTWQCVASYMGVYFKKKMEYADASELLLKIYKIFTGATADNIPHAPERSCMEEYGGSMTIEEYEASIKPVEIYDRIKMRNISIEADI
jgi:hypothetical protein